MSKTRVPQSGIIFLFLLICLVLVIAGYRLVLKRTSSVGTPSRTVNENTGSNILGLLKDRFGNNDEANPVQQFSSYPALTGYPAQNTRTTSDLVVYQVWLNYYAQNRAVGNDSDNVFANAASHLDELSRLGITMVQLSPFHPFLNKTTLGSPYGSLDYYDVNPGYAPGGRDDRIQALKDYIAKAHENNIDVIMDCVYHSTDPRNVLNASHPEYYLKNGSGEVVKNRYGFSVLDYNNPATREYMIDMVKYWEKTVDIDGCRADVAVDVPLSFWATLNNEMKKIKPDWFMVAETTSKIAEYAGPYSGPTHLNENFDSVYGFDAVYGVNHMLALRAILNDNRDASFVKKAWETPEQGKVVPEEVVLYRSVDNHDQRPRVPLLAAGNEGLLASMAINLTLDGIPFIFNGQEIGDLNPTSISVQRYIAWNDPPNPQNREIIRTLIALRRSHPALQKGETVWYTSDDPQRVVSFLRQEGDEKILVVVNLSSSGWSGTVQGTAERPLNGKAVSLSGKGEAVRPVQDNSLRLTLGPRAYFIASLE